MPPATFQGLSGARSCVPLTASHGGTGSPEYTTVERVMGSALGVRKVHAARMGITLDEYDARVAAGKKRCTRCKAWHPRSAFGADRSRSDGLDASCRTSRMTVVDRPGKAERRQRRADGFAWCRDCAAWLPLELVAQGRCRPHRNAQMRAHYARNAATIRPRKTARTRHLERVPPWWEAEKFSDFGGLCAYGCNRKATELDHVWPVARGGRSEPSNLIPACFSCNSSKKDHDPAPWVQRFADAFPDQFESLFALALEMPSSLDILAVTADLVAAA